MKQDEIIEMARKVGLVIDGNQSGFDDLAAFAKLVAAKAFQNGYEKGVAAFTEAVNLEREVCAKTLESISNAPDMQSYANAIRARGDQA